MEGPAGAAVAAGAAFAAGAAGAAGAAVGSEPQPTSISETTTSNIAINLNFSISELLVIFNSVLTRGCWAAIRRAHLCNRGHIGRPRFSTSLEM
ncbi:MAG: hypothetical protein FI737_14585 [SAR202 cluster bacterium]|nr:hypothetical protein [SAR202 cluster bacterium]